MTISEDSVQLSEEELEALEAAFDQLNQKLERLIAGIDENIRAFHEATNAIRNLR